MTFQPGRALPTDPLTSQERTLYHAPRKSGEMATMTREGGTWQWRQLHGRAEDEYGTGSWGGAAEVAESVTNETPRTLA